MLSVIQVVCAIGCCVTAAFSLYLASAHQKLVLQSLPRKALTITGCTLLVTALILIVQVAGSATSVFIMLTVLMLLWTVLPPLIVYFRNSKG